MKEVIKNIFTGYTNDLGTFIFMWIGIALTASIIALIVAVSL